ncbi:MAG: tRNA (adenosine(37)-N6)-threonylcarbamoyltransferase complex ATPase subunit type 1 TsaE [Ignavibacteriaceae bacterium]
MDYPFSKIVNSEEETALLAEDFIIGVSPGDIIVLNGNLGSGKTFFIKKSLEKYGVNNVSSPTFAIVNEYNGKFKIYHFDFYRINKIRELFDIGFNDYINDEDAVIFIEWGELFKEIIPRKRIEINITLNQDFSRKFEIKRYE